MTQYKLSIIIVSWNVCDLLRDCLNSVVADIKASQLEAQIIMVDCASTDNTVEMIQTEFPNLTLLLSQENLGFAGGNNLALRYLGFTDKPEAKAQAQAEDKPGQSQYILLLNPDTIVQAGALNALLNFIDSQPQAGIAGANLRFGDGSFQHGAYAFPGLWQLAIELFPLPGRFYESKFNGRYPRHLYDGSQPFPIDHPLGAAMLVRGEAIQQAGLLDEGYKMYVEEVDWAKRITAAGWAAYCVPTAHIVHLGGQSTGQIKQESFLNLWQSRYRFYKRYYAGWRFRLAKLLVQQGMAHQIKQRPADRAVFAAVQEIWKS